MPSLLYYHSPGVWSRQALPAPGLAAFRVAGSAPAAIAVSGEDLPELPPDCDALIVVDADCAAFLLASPATVAFLNAETLAIGPIRQLRDRDRLTYHNGTHIVRLWFRHPDAGTRIYRGVPAVLACGYCTERFAVGSTFTTCPCGETLHVDCADHGGRRCPRCHAELTDAAEWLPDGFPPPQEVTADDW
jgi:hypothetical protein